MDEKRASEATQLYGVGDLAAALKVPHGYVTPLLNRGIFCPTHQWRGFRLFTHERIEQIVSEHGSLIRATSLSGASSPINVVTADNESGHDEV
jgi:hypothetical protein